jgi:hypothetical protein
MSLVSALALVANLLALGSSGADSSAFDSLRVLQARAFDKAHPSLSIGVGSDYDLLLVSPRGKLLRFGRGVAEAQRRREFAADHFPGRVTQIHVEDAIAGTWKLRVAVDGDMKWLSVYAFASGSSAWDVIAPINHDHAQWWKLRLSRDAKRDTCWMKMARWKREKIRR